MTTLILAVGISVGVSALCSLLEAILYSTRAVTLEAAAARGVRQAGAMLRLTSEVERPLSAILILNTLANTAGAALAGWAAGRLWGAGSLWVFSLAFTLTILVCSEIVPKTVGAVHWRRLWRWAVWPLNLMVTLLKPLIWFTQAITTLITRRGRQEPVVSEEEILAAARLGASGGEISKLEEELIHNIIQLESIKAKDIMTPRTVMLSIDGRTSIGEARQQCQDWPYTRVPVYLGQAEEIVGYVMKPEILTTNLDPQAEVRLLAKPIRFVPATANALNLLNAFLRRREHLYMVVDEYGGIMGLVTLEDVVESLVGSEIVDESDQVEDLQELARHRGAAVLQSEDAAGGEDDEGGDHGF